MLITISQSPEWRLQMFSLCPRTVNNLKTLHVLSEMTKKSFKSLHFRRWNKKKKLEIFASEMTETINQSSKWFAIHFILLHLMIKWLFVAALLFILLFSSISLSSLWCSSSSVNNTENVEIAFQTLILVGSMWRLPSQNVCYKSNAAAMNFTPLSFPASGPCRRDWAHLNASYCCCACVR